MAGVYNVADDEAYLDYYFATTFVPLFFHTTTTTLLLLLKRTLQFIMPSLKSKRKLKVNIMATRIDYNR